MEPVEKQTNWKAVFAVGAILLLTTEVVLLILQNRDLKKQLNNVLTAKAPETLKPGEFVPPFRGMAMDGAAREVTYQDSTKKYLLFVLSTTCPHCEKTLPVWKKIAAGTKPDDCDIIGVSVSNHDETKSYVEKKEIDFTVTKADTSFSRHYKVSGVPMTILIQANGIIEKVWSGELPDESREEIIKLVREKHASINPLN